jgi:hypothetical protein
MLLWGDIKNITLSYERLIKKNQSIAMQLGYLVPPKFLGDTLLHLFNLNGYSRQGINIAFDYRYYPGLRNRRPAPDGLDLKKKLPHTFETAPLFVEIQKDTFALILCLSKQV